MVDKIPVKTESELSIEIFIKIFRFRFLKNKIGTDDSNSILQKQAMINFNN